ncbi:MAG: hypothetical protein WDZ57_04365 [Demequina sp.]
MAEKRRRGGGCAALLVLLLAAGLAVAYGPGFLDQYGDRLFSQSRCTVSLGDDTHTLTAEQSNNAALIAARSAARNLPARAATIALATAIQESGLRNINYGDRDSLGLFQQRPSQGWGTVAEVMDPYHSSDEFYRYLITVDGWRDMPVTEAAQRVQRSAFPEAYGAHEPESRLWASALRGHSGPDVVKCSLGRADAGSAQVFADRLRADFGEDRYQIDVQDRRVGVTYVAVFPTSGSDTERDALAAWAVATAATTSVESVTINGTGWSRDAYDYTLEESGDGVTVGVRTDD